MKNSSMIQITDAVFFEDTLKKGHPYVSAAPRNHESLFFVKKGNLLYEKNGKKAVVREGQVGYIQRGSCDISGAYRCDEVSYYAVNFCFDRTPTPKSGALPFPTLCSSGIQYYPYKALFHKGTMESNLKGSGSDYLVNGILMEIIGYLYKEFYMDKDNIHQYRRIDQTVEYMKTHAGDAELQIFKLSAISQMSEKNFRRIFKALYGQTPYAFLQKYRIEKAEILLMNTNKSISEIALSCGFSDVYSFSHCFKRHFGISPQGYRMSASEK